MAVDWANVALAEFESLRSEIAAHQRTKTQYLTLAITATGAIGSFALGRNGNRDALLVLPLVLSGLTLVYLRHNVDIELIGEYVRNELWPVLRVVEARAGTGAAPLPSWDDWIQDRRSRISRRSAYGALGILPPFFIFGSPGLGALVIAYERSKTMPLALVWWLDAVALLLSIALTIWAYTSAPGWKAAREAGAPPATSKRGRQRS
jgi:hypothetical protein